MDTSLNEIRYTLVARFSNALEPIPGCAPGLPATDFCHVSITHAEVSIAETSGAPVTELAGFPDPYTVAVGGGIVPASDGLSLGYGYGAIPVLDAERGRQLRGVDGRSLRVTIVASGSTFGREVVQTPPFTISLRLCDGCLFECRRGPDRVPIDEPACTPGQDQVSASPSACDR